MKKRNKIVKLYDRFLQAHIWCTWGMDIDTHEKLISKELGTKYDSTINRNIHGYCSFHENIHGQQLTIIYVKKEGDMYTFIHEVTHAIFDIFLDREIPIGKGTEECFAYYIEYIYRELIGGLVQ